MMVTSKKTTVPKLFKFRLRVAIVVPFVLQIAATVGLVSYISFRSSQKAVNDLAIQLRNEITARIDGELRKYLESSHNFNRLNAATFAQGKFDLKNASNAKQFLTQIEISPFIYSSYCGDSQGQSLGAYRFIDHGSSTIAMSVSNKETNYNFFFYAMDKQGNKQQILAKLKPYDPRQRPWYISAVTAKRAIWSEVYLDFASGLPTITASEPIYDESGQNVLGVCATDVVLLSDLRKFLANLSIGKTGRAFIIDRTGAMLSSSTDEPLTVGEGENTKLVLAAESIEPSVRETARYLQKHFGSFDRIEQLQQLDYQLQGERQYVQVLPLNDGKGIDWLIVVVVPETDFMAQINANTRNTIWLTLAALGLAIAIGIFTARLITHSVFRLIQASQEIAKGNLERQVSTVNVIEIEEIDTLENSFNTMAAQLKESFDKLTSVIFQAEQVGNQISLSTNQIVTANQQIEATAIQQATSTNEVRATAHQIASTSGQLVNKMENIVEQATTTELSASQGQKGLLEIAQVMEQLVRSTNLIASQLGMMNEKANSISSVVLTIAKVADQTNLISLNATIEAEKAGEAGVGFVVVAREVQRLADRSAAASREIEDIVKDLQSSVAQGVNEMDKFSQQVSYYGLQVGRISGQIAQVIQQVQSLTPQFQQISYSMEGQFAGAQQISFAIAQLSEASQQTVLSLQETNQALKELNDTAQELQNLVKSS